jgi:ABC-type transporter Mla maintaining outer membrane lipid asymmetry ATPase subunit MlaF
MSENQSIPAIEMRGVDVGAIHDPGLTVIEEVNWTVAPGEFWIVAGQQNSGKSDFLMTTAGLMAPLKGSYNFFGSETQMFDESRLADRLRLGFVFETAKLFHHLTIAENVALPLQYHKNLPDDAVSREVQMLLELLELTPFADNVPTYVSANWLKRAALARALILKPEVLLLDNPLGGLDTRHSRWWLYFLDELWRGHAWFDGRPMTVVATADDLSRVAGWRGGTRRFALLKEKKFIPLGSWNEVASVNEPVVKELLAVSAAPLIKIKTNQDYKSG